MASAPNYQTAAAVPSDVSPRHVASHLINLFQHAPMDPTSTTEEWYVLPAAFEEDLQAVADGAKNQIEKIHNYDFIVDSGGWNEISCSNNDHEIDASMKSEYSVPLLPVAINSPQRQIHAAIVPTIDTLLKGDFSFGIDFKLYPKSTWEEILKARVEFDVAIPRAVIAEGDGLKRVEVQPLELRVFIPKNRTDQSSPPPSVNATNNGQVTVNFSLRLNDISPVMRTFLEVLLGRFFESKDDELLSFVAVMPYLTCTSICISRSKSEEDLFAHFRAQIRSNNSEQILILNAERPDDSVPGSSGELATNWTCLRIEETNRTKESANKPVLPPSSSEPLKNKFRPAAERATLGDLIQDASTDLLVLTPMSDIISLKLRTEAESVGTADSLVDSPSYSLANALETGGLVGLRNLGNTCFMNAALQCLAHTLPLARFYLSNAFEDNLNKENPLGMGGLLAKTYYGWLKSFWIASQEEDLSKNSRPYVTPNDLKRVIGQFAPNFRGYSQQDSQELLAFLLDGLHEDCNRIVQKPYVEAIDGTGKETDMELGHKSWDCHKMRNNSLIVDLFQGQFRSRLECPTCKMISRTFDPFMYCSLPIPVTKRCLVTVALFVADSMTTPSWPYLIPMDILFRSESLNRLSADRSSADLSTPLLDNILHQDTPMKAVQWKLHKVLSAVLNTPETNSNPKTETLRKMLQNKNIEQLISTALFDIFSPIVPLGSLATDESSKNSDEKLNISRHYKYTAPPKQPNLVGDPYFSQIRCILPLKSDSQPSFEDNLMISMSLPVPNGIILKPTTPDTDCLTWTWLINMKNVENMSIGSFLNTIVLEHAVEGLEQFKDLVSSSGTVKACVQEAVWRIFPISGGKTVAENIHLTYEPSMKQLIRIDQPLDSAAAAVMSNEMKCIEVFKEWNFFSSSGGAPHRIHIESESRSVWKFCEVNKDIVRLMTRKNSVPYTTLGRLCNGIDLSQEMFSLYPGLEQEVELCVQIDRVSGSIIPFLPSPFYSPRHHNLTVAYHRQESVQRDHGSIGLLDSPAVDLNECFQEFISAERLEDDNQWYCSKCKEFRPALKQMSFWRLPDVLVVHLKRFSQEWHWRSKIQTVVKFPWRNGEELDIKDFLHDGACEENTKYRLFAIINHAGMLGSGHYEASVKCYFGSKDDPVLKWYQFSDTFVGPVRDDDHCNEQEDDIPEDQFINSSAYLLFYERMGSRFYHD